METPLVRALDNECGAAWEFKTARRAGEGSAGPRPRREESGLAVGRSLAEQMFLEIRFGVLSGRYLPGQVLDRSSLYAAYGCSPVAAADVLKALVAEGYLIHEKRQYAVRIWSRGEVEDLYDLRSSLEGLAAERAAERASDAEIAQLLSLVSDTSDLSFTDPCDIERVTLDNIRFHAEVVRLAKSPPLAELARSVIPNALHRRIVWAQHADDAKQSWRTHRKIADAIADRSAALARLSMREDIFSSREAVLAAIDELSNRPCKEIVQVERLTGSVEHDGRRFGQGTREAGLDGKVVPFGVPASVAG